VNLHTSLWLFQAVHALGLALWLSIAVINNLQGFHGSAGAIGTTLSMALFTEAPAVETPLRRRASGSSLWSCAALIMVLALQIMAALACWAGAYWLIVAGDLNAARPWLNAALSGAAVFLFAMHLGGLWFGYWIKQEGLQLTHLVLLIWVVAIFFLFNAPWV
jgi:hypothetical protein